MTEKTLLTLPIVCASASDLSPALDRQQANGLLTRNQALAILTVCAAALPATVSLYQRTPKGTTYVHIDRELAYTVDQTARVRIQDGADKKIIPHIPTSDRANYAFSRIKPGESLTVTRTDPVEMRNARGAAYRAAQYYGWKITTRKTPDGLKVQRIT